MSNLAKTSSFRLYGRHSVLGALANKNRTILSCIIHTKHYKEVSKLPFFLRLKHIIKFTDNNNIFDSKLGTFVKHQGFMLETYALSQPTLVDLMKQLHHKEHSNLILLDGSFDTQNIGAIIRSAAAFNIDAIILNANNSVKESPAMAAAAVGAIERIKLIYVKSMQVTIHKLKEEGFWLVGLDGKANTLIQSFKPFNKNVLVLGAESGLSPINLKRCDVAVKIGIQSNVESLNVSNALAIACFHLTTSGIET